MSTHVVEARGLRKAYRGENAPVRALRGVDFSQEEGEFVAVMGPSGSGKSTLLNLLAGLDRPDDGQLYVAGESLRDKSDDELALLRRRHIGIVFQFFNLLEGMTVLENVVMPGVIAGRSRRDAEFRAKDLLDLVGLSGKLRTAAADLSGGQLQRVSIARALATEPTVLFADEPTGALDSDGASDVLGLFTRLNERGQTILLVTHDPVVAAAAQRTVTMRDGRFEVTAP